MEDKNTIRGRTTSPAPFATRSISPLGQEIVAQDISYLQDDEDIATPDSDGGDVSVPALILRPTAITFGPTIRPSLGPHEAELIPARQTRRERTLSRNAERSLLRDNLLLPPKHGFPSDESFFRRAYRSIFSTKIRSPSTAAVLSETSPLLGDASVVEESRRWEAAVATNFIQTTWQREALTLLQYSRSLALTFILHYSVTMTSTFAVAYIGKLELGAASLATVTANITCYSPVIGLSTSLDTLCSQAFGSGHKRLVGLQCQRMMYLLWLLLFPIALLWYHADVILTAVIPETETALMAARYLRFLILGTPGVAAFEVGKRFVQAQGLFHATTYVLLIGAPLNLVFNWVLVWKLGLGFDGAPLAVASTQLLLPFLLLGYVIFIDGSQCWDGFSRRALHNWGPMIKLALPGMLMIEAQYFAFELLTIVSGQFGEASLVAQSILVTLGATGYQMPFAVSIAASTRVANLIGARLKDAAWTSMKVALVAACVIGIFNMIIMYTCRYTLVSMFTDDPDVTRIVVQVIPILAIMQLFDALAAGLHGLLRGIGRQYVGGYSNLLSFYLVALPISFSTGFACGWELSGLWFGVSVGLVLVTLVEFLYVCNVDWEHAMLEAEDRVRSDGHHDSTK